MLSAAYLAWLTAMNKEQESINWTELYVSTEGMADGATLAVASARMRASAHVKAGGKSSASRDARLPDYRSPAGAGFSPVVGPAASARRAMPLSQRCTLDEVADLEMGAACGCIPFKSSRRTTRGSGPLAAGAVPRSLVARLGALLPPQIQASSARNGASDTFFDAVSGSFYSAGSETPLQAAAKAVMNHHQSVAAAVAAANKHSQGSSDDAMSFVSIPLS